MTPWEPSRVVRERRGRLARSRRKADNKVLAVDGRQWKEGQRRPGSPTRRARSMASATPSSSTACRPLPTSPIRCQGCDGFPRRRDRRALQGISGRIDQGAGILFNLQPNGDYLTIRANPLENNLVLWKFEKGKRSSVKWIRNTPTPTRQWHDLKVRIAATRSKAISTASSILSIVARAGFGAHRPLVEGRQLRVFRRLTVTPSD